ncbi:MAG: flagellar motor stator protein MotA [Rhodospirillaceae bacterium]|nr:flagellar motor stator protein MotA [Rhodospirillaceae bacterium]HAA92025.1 flagellar motor stator protein MotA [Rhodospirillaceae bacterium]
MFVVIGCVVVTLCVIGSYVALGGKLGVLWQPFELVIIGGSGVGAFMIGNPPVILKKAIGSLLQLLKGPKYKKKDYIELLSMLYQTLRLAKTKGMLALETHVENPESSTLFEQFPGFKSNHHALEFMCDYLRLMTLGTDNALEVETLMDQELDVHHMEAHRVSHAVNSMAESFPGLGIVAAVLGVIKTMGSITEPPEVLGGLIAAALVGTFLGILLCYGFFAPMAAAIKGNDEDDHQYFVVMKVALLAHLQGYAPAVAIEFARKTLMSGVRPTFLELEEETGNLPPV